MASGEAGAVRSTGGEKSRPGRDSCSIGFGYALNVSYPAPQQNAEVAEVEVSKEMVRRDFSVWLTVAAALWIVIAGLSLVPGSERPHTGYSSDMEHLMAYFGTGAITALTFRSTPTIWLALPFFAASAIFEFVQILIPGRSPLFENWLASSLGALFGILIARAIVQPVIVRLGW